MLFVLSKVFWFIAEPGNLLLLVLLAGWARAARRRGKGLILLGIAAFGFLAAAVLPLWAWIAAPLEDRFPAPARLPDRVDGIVLLGGAVDAVLSQIRGQVALDEAAERVTETVILARAHPEARILVSGGEGTLIAYGFPEAEATRTLLAQLGIEPARIETEGRSRNTWENAVFSLAAVKPQPGENWVLVTSAAHMPRAMGCFRRAGWRIIPFPVDYRTPRTGPPFSFSLGRNLADFAAPAKEWLGLASYYWLGRTDALFPGPES